MLGKNSIASPVETYALAADKGPEILVSAAANAARAQNQRRSDAQPRVRCDYCNKPRHTQENCWKLHGKPASFKNRLGDKATPTGNMDETGSLSKKQPNQILQLLKSNIPSVSFRT